MTFYRARTIKPGPVPFGLCRIGNQSVSLPDVQCRDCAHARRMTAPAWRGCALGHVPHRALEQHVCADWKPKP